MRDIKFRAWDKKYQSIINHTYLACYVFKSVLENQDIILMQFTGCCDNWHKVEIYEGDIIKVTAEDCDEDYLTTVRYEQGAFVVDVHGEDYEVTALGWAIDLWDNNGDDWKVIGNIYEK